MPVAPPLVGTKGSPGHYTVLGHQPASDMAVTKSSMTKADVEEGLRAMKLALFERENRAREASEARRSGVQSNVPGGQSGSGVPPSIVPVSTTGGGAIGDVPAVAGGPRKLVSGASKRFHKGPKKDPNRIRGVDSDDEDEFDDDDWDEDDYDSEGNYIAGDREEGDVEEGEGGKPEREDGRDDDGGVLMDPPAAVAAAPPPEPWAVRRKRELAEKKAKEKELHPYATGNRKDSVLSSLGKAWGNSEVWVGVV